MRPRMIRPIALCVVRDGERLFVSEASDPSTDELFYRPLGGGIEFGERSADAVVRELREEIGAELIDVRCLGIIENVFTYNGETGHEIVVVYEAGFVDHSLRQQERVHGWDGVHNKDPLVAVWKPLQWFVDERAPLYPDGLLELLTAQAHPAIIGRTTTPS